jgi:hypothetical protein
VLIHHLPYCLALFLLVGLPDSTGDHVPRWAPAILVSPGEGGHFIPLPFM